MADNCPNCGAPINGFECKYCGAMFYDFANLSFEKPVYLRYRDSKSGNVLLMKTYLSDLELRTDTDYDTVYTEFQVLTMRQQLHHSVRASFVKVR